MCVTKSEHPFLLSHGSWKSGGGGVLKRSPLLLTPQKPGS